MSQKFSIVVEVRGGKPVSTAYLKLDAAEAVKHFLKLREAGSEAYLFQHPLADRRCKSAEQVKATLGERDENGKVADSAQPSAPSVPEWKKNEIQQPAPKKRRNQIDGVSLDIDPTAPKAVDM